MLSFPGSIFTTLFIFLVGVLSSQDADLNARCECSLNPRSRFLREVLSCSDYPNHPTVRTPSSTPLKIGIIGAGAAGLYSAVLLDSLGIDYDILEASDRVGGRIFTYRFNETAWDASTPDNPDYYDYYVSTLLLSSDGTDSRCRTLAQ